MWQLWGGCGNIMVISGNVVVMKRRLCYFRGNDDVAMTILWGSCGNDVVMMGVVVVILR